jgi:hypothetical protein
MGNLSEVREHQTMQKCQLLHLDIWPCWWRLVLQYKVFMRIREWCSKLKSLLTFLTNENGGWILLAEYTMLWSREIRGFQKIVSRLHTSRLDVLIMNKCGVCWDAIVAFFWSDRNRHVRWWVVTEIRSKNVR